MESLMTLLPNGSHSKPEEVSDRLLTLLNGATFSEQAMRTARCEIQDALRTDAVCPTCERLSNCKLDSPGWQVFFDSVAAEMYRRPVFRYNKCPYWQAQEVHQQVENAVGKRFAVRSFSTWIHTEQNEAVFNAAKDYADQLAKDTQGGLMFVGNVGTGKTHLAVSILKVALDKGISGAIVVVPKLLEEIRQAYGDQEADQRLAQRAREKHFLVLDDLGVEKPTDWVREQLYLLVNHRYEHLLPTICTSNLGLAGMERNIGKRTVDRLIEMCLIIPFTGESRRRR